MFCQGEPSFDPVAPPPPHPRAKLNQHLQQGWGAGGVRMRFRTNFHSGSYIPPAFKLLPRPPPPPP